MEISQITAFLAVAEELHFGRAAQRLHSAQPPLSRTIRQLEKQLGATLFDRNTRNVRLTSAGEALLGPAREILDACRLAEIAVAAAGRGQVGRVRIGFSGVSSHLLIGRWAKLVRHTHPGIEFVLNSSAFASEALNKLLDGTLDIGLGRWIFTPPGIASRVILNEDFVVAVTADHPLAGRDGVRIEELATEPWVALPADPGSALRDSLLRAAHDAGFTPRIVQSAPDSMSLMALVSAEVGCALTVSSVVENVNNPDVVFLPLVGGPSTLQLRIAWRADDDSAALREVLRLSEEALPTPE
ncbi:LysR family transcriptional regulator [Rhodococcus sp. USK10]|uniref:LysR family transcriptional regulator YnfL n=2 Tax=Rhodococcus TaxID=1827 RepID=A0A402CBU3_RHOWR|nr:MULTISPECIES: LysR family transcriptional regulator [Rhodococcus]MBV6762814.1 LysR family transcriptional regulator [Rhodococcus opacus]QSE91001.1 LysR family transcriptional regulator [Rhodococcus pseudokoreensis]QYB01655.1 LysR family transcriptional regulator [Rhodococcus sp. USK10]GCE41084.1 LysR family transcriptional regulator YnfL [Rhodococcus wratislaviensis]